LKNYDEGKNPGSDGREAATAPGSDPAAGDDDNDSADDEPIDSDGDADGSRRRRRR